MGFRRHKTPEEKFSRRMAYARLREAGFNSRIALKLRDWNDNKIEKLEKHEIKPIGIY